MVVRAKLIHRRKYEELHNSDTYVINWKVEEVGLMCGCGNIWLWHRGLEQENWYEQKIHQQAGQQYGACWGEGGRGRSWLWSSGRFKGKGLLLLNNNFPEGHLEILYILVQESYRDLRMWHLRDLVCHAVTGHWTCVKVQHQQNRLGSQEMMLKPLFWALLGRLCCFWKVFEESQRNTCSLKSQVLMWCFLNLNCHCVPCSHIQKKIMSFVLKGVSSTVEYQTVELERELEKVKSKKTNLGNELTSVSCIL